MTELGCRLIVMKERKMMLRSLAWVPGGPGADFLVWELQSVSIFPSRAAYSAAGNVLKHTLCCVLGIMELLRHVVGWVFRI